MGLIVTLIDEQGVAGSCIHSIYHDGGAVANVATFPFKHDTLVMTRLWVAPQQRRQGLATALVAHVCSLADQQRKTIRIVPELSADSTIDLDSLRAFYRRFGFVGKLGMLRLPVSLDPR